MMGNGRICAECNSLIRPLADPMETVHQLSDRPYARAGYNSCEIVTNGHLLLARPGDGPDQPIVSDLLASISRVQVDTEIDLRPALNLEPFRIESCPCGNDVVRYPWGEGPCPFCEGDGRLFEPPKSRSLECAVGRAIVDSRYLALVAMHLLPTGEPAYRSHQAEMEAVIFRSGDRYAVLMPMLADGSVGKGPTF